MLKLITRLKSHLSFYKKKQLFFLFLMMISLSFTEAFSLATIVPFIGIFLNPDIFFSHPWLNPFIIFFEIKNEDQLFLSITIIFIFFVILSGLIKLLFIYKSNNISQSIESDLRSKIFKNYIEQSYSYHLDQNSNEVMSNIMQKTSSMALYINEFIGILSSLLTILLVFTFLIFLKPFIIIPIVSFLVIFFVIIFSLNKKKILENSKKISENQDRLVTIFQNSIGYISEMIIYSLHNIFISKFNKSSNILAANFAYNHNKTQSPRIYLEYATLLCLATLIYFLNKSGGNVINSLTVLAALGLGTQKMLPLINRVHVSLTRMKGVQQVVADTLSLLDNSKKEISENSYSGKLFLKKTIKLENINFSYNKKTNFILKNINLEIKKGSKVGIKGATGSGKSTLGNIIIGLLEPTEGQLLIDDILINSQNKSAWQKNISIIPQTIFMNDSTIAENIAIGIEPKYINLEKVKKAAKEAHIHEFIINTPNQYNEKVGERGIKLSGGQRQRISIARALYREAQIILFDEATNQLDTDTESLIMQSINNLDKEVTVLFITHRLSTLENCDQIIDLTKKTND